MTVGEKKPPRCFFFCFCVCLREAPPRCLKRAGRIHEEVALVETWAPGSDGRPGKTEVGLK